MIQRHPYCKIDNCEICLEDHEILEERLKVETGVTLIDHLCEYRKFMDNKLGKSSETKWGWACPEVFEEENIKAYLEKNETSTGGLNEMSNLQGKHNKSFPTG